MRSVSDRHLRFTILSVAAAIALAVLTVWSVRLVLDVGQLRDQVEQRVGWLRSISQVRSAIDGSQSLSAEEWQQHRARLDEMTASVRVSSLAGEPTFAPQVEHQNAHPGDPASAEVRTELERLVLDVRGQTAQLSADLGDRWDSINLLVVTSLFFATSTLGLLVYARSVTLPRTEGTVAKLEARLRTSDRLAAVGTLAAGVAHEINNPLTYVTTNLQLLAEELRELDVGAADRISPLIDDAIGGASRVGSIVRQLETFARVPTDIQESADPVRCLNAAVGELDPSIRVERDFPPTPRTRGDASFMEEVFRNLVDNAVKALHDVPGDRVLSLRSGTGDDGMVRISIADTGPGIPDTVLKRMLEPFVTTREVGGGTGLGLFVSHGVVSALGGSMEFETSSAGTTVTVVLPPADALEHDKPV